MTFALSNYLAADSSAQALRRDVRRGLTQTPKSLPPKWFYDSVGSELFDQITRLPEYYPTRAEAQILLDRSAEIVAASGADTLVELGSGTSEKTRMLLNALRDRGALKRFIPFDVLLEPVLDRLKAEVRKRQGAAARIMVPFKDDPNRAFTHESVLDTLRLANRVPNFPCNARNLASLMFVRPDRPTEDLYEEVAETLRELQSRRIFQSRATLSADTEWTSATNTVFDGTYRHILGAASGRAKQRR